ncbi:MAG TPA: DnaJ domain-containing protein [candidate division Zixibacteria bacterium]|nr:DnaJ domain-containing protein [candidate division Zixibacteria bacterium]
MEGERRDPYRILNVIPGADPDVIKAAYRVLARKLHPDAGAAMDEATARRMVDLNWAYAQIRDAAARQRWETERKAPPPPTAAGPRTHGAGWTPEDPTAVVLDFGRYRGWTLREIARRDLEYLSWLRRHASGARFRGAIDQLLREGRGRSGGTARR